MKKAVAKSKTQSIQSDSNSQELHLMITDLEDINHLSSEAKERLASQVTKIKQAMRGHNALLVAGCEKSVLDSIESAIDSLIKKYNRSILKEHSSHEKEKAKKSKKPNEQKNRRAKNSGANTTILSRRRKKSLSQSDRAIAMRAMRRNETPKAKRARLDHQSKLLKLNRKKHEAMNAKH